MAAFKVNYSDGSTETVPVTMRAICKAEEHALEAGWQSMTQSPTRSMAYAVYSAIRFSGRQLPGFDQWLGTVDGIEQTTAPTANPTV